MDFKIQKLNLNKGLLKSNGQQLILIREKKEGKKNYIKIKME